MNSEGEMGFHLHFLQNRGKKVIFHAIEVVAHLVGGRTFASIKSSETKSTIVGNFIGCSSHFP